MDKNFLKDIARMLSKHPAPWIAGSIEGSTTIYDANHTPIVTLNKVDSISVFSSSEDFQSICAQIVTDSVNAIDQSIKEYLRNNQDLLEGSTDESSLT